MRPIFKKAFTLIELLVVVAIISLLSSVVIVSLQDSREKAAIAKLREQTRQVQTALELYRNDFGEYPDYVFEDMETVIANDLSPYIENIQFDVSNIKSIPIQEASDGIIIGFINNQSLNTSMNRLTSCEDYGDIPYTISFFTADEFETDEFLRYTLKLNTDLESILGIQPYEILAGAYCLNTPI